MRKLLTLLALFAAFYVHGQDMKGVLDMMGPQQRSCDVGHGQSKFRVKSLGLRLGQVADRYTGLSAERMVGFAQQPEQFDAIDLGSYALVNGNAMLSGMNFGVYLSLQPFSNKRRGWNASQELRLELNKSFNRELFVDYAPTSSLQTNSISYCLVQNEWALNVSYLFNARAGRLSGYAGPSLGMGVTHRNSMFIVSPSYPELSSKAKGSNYWRALLLTGVSYDIVKELALTMELQAGTGLHAVKKAQNQAIAGSFGLHVGLRYNVVQFKRR